ncbi:hypothetical protein Poly59_27470 [Rubripirellula reticaptiva]|uniref:Uncharacterized protein n=1 Tax=Rubripirellula reticaptiva TaxID=2528013 RepID=A0A5C6ESR9_9BACT|nr:hypothetical protein Poly59_27470 [Rubripirellula reticaptiva]
MKALDPGRIQLHEPPDTAAMPEGTTLTAGPRVEFNPATRLGNVTRTFAHHDMFGRSGETMLELSFPALKGASGSPVMAPGHEVWGIVVANHSVDLLPSQVEEIFDESGKLEERTTFTLPQALAINVMHIRAFVDEVAAGETEP